MSQNFSSLYEQIKKSIHEHRETFLTKVTNYTKQIVANYENFYNEIEAISKNESHNVKKEKDRTKLLNSINDLHQCLCKTVLENMELLNNLLSRKNLHSESFLNQSFIEDNLKLILNSWLLSCLNFKNLGLKSILEEKNLNKNLKRIISQDIIEEKNYLEIDSPDIRLCEKEKEIIKTDSNNFKKMKLANLNKENLLILFTHMKENLSSDVSETNAEEDGKKEEDLNIDEFFKTKIKTNLTEKDILESSSDDEGENSLGGVYRKISMNTNRKVSSIESKDDIDIQEVLHIIREANPNVVQANDEDFDLKEILKETNRKEDKTQNEQNNLPKYFQKLKKININNCNLDDFQFQVRFPSLEVIQIKNSIYKFNNRKYFNKLRSLTLKKCNLTSISCENFLLDFIKNNEARMNLQILNLSSNKITHIDFDFDFLLSLKELNLEDNRLNRVGNFKGPLSKLKLLNIVGNNFVYDEDFEDLIEQKNYHNHFIVLFSRNGITYDKKEEYLESLNEKFSQMDTNISYLSFEMLFSQKDIDSLLNFEFSPQLQQGIKKINLSYCGLNDDILIEFLSKSNLSNLEKLNLSGNLLTDKFIEDFCDLDSSLFNLKKLNLSKNKGVEGVGHFEKYIKFFEKQFQLKKLIIYKTEFEKNYIAFHKKDRGGLFRKLSMDEENFIMEDDKRKLSMQIMPKDIEEGNEDKEKVAQNSDFKYFIETFKENFSKRKLVILIRNFLKNSLETVDYEKMYIKTSKVFIFKNKTVKY